MGGASLGGGGDRGWCGGDRGGCGGVIQGCAGGINYVKYIADFESWHRHVGICEA